RQSAAARGPTMDGHELANARASSNLGLSFFAGEFQVLRRQTNRDKRIDVRFVADPRAAIDQTMRVDANYVAKLDVIANRYVRPNRAAFSDARLRTDDRRSVDFG